MADGLSFDDAQKLREKILSKKKKDSLLEESALGSQLLVTIKEGSESEDASDVASDYYSEEELFPATNAPRSSLAIVPPELPTKKKLPSISRGATRVKTRSRISENTSKLSNIPSRASLRTADLIGQKYKSWYANTRYVAEKKHRPKYMGNSHRSIRINLKNGIYHSLEPQELAPEVKIHMPKFTL